MVETIDVAALKRQQETAKEAQKVEEKKTKAIKVKVSKRPVNNNMRMPEAPQQVSTDMLLQGEYKSTVPVLLVEAFARGLPQFAPAREDRLRKRLLQSHDLGILMEKVFMNYHVESDKLKLLLTLGYHGANEVMECMMSNSPPSTAQPVACQEDPKPSSGSNDFDLTPKKLSSS